MEFDPFPWKDYLDFNGICGVYKILIVLLICQFSLIFVVLCYLLGGNKEEEDEAPSESTKTIDTKSTTTIEPPATPPITPPIVIPPTKPREVNFRNYWGEEANLDDIQKVAENLDPDDLERIRDRNLEGQPALANATQNIKQAIDTRQALGLTGHVIAGCIVNGEIKTFEEAKEDNLIPPALMTQLYEAQAATGRIIDPTDGGAFSAVLQMNRARNALARFILI